MLMYKTHYQLTIEDMLCHSSITNTKLIPKSLIKILKGSNNELAVQCFKNITGYMLDRKTSKPPLGHIAKLMKIGELHYYCYYCCYYCYCCCCSVANTLRGSIPW